MEPEFELIEATSGDELRALVNAWLQGKVFATITSEYQPMYTADTGMYYSVAILYTLLPQSDTPIVFQGGINEKDN